LARLIAVVAMLIATVSSGFQSAGAQNGDSFEYDDDGVNWLVEWDGDVWSEADSTTADLALESDTGVAQFVTIFEDVTPEECLAGVLPSFEESFGAEDADTIATVDGDPIIDDNQDYAFELRSMTSSDGAELLAVHVCYQLAEGGLLWAITVVPSDDPEVIGQGYALYDGIEVEGDVYELDFAGLTEDTDYAAEGSSSGTGGNEGDGEDASPSSRTSDDDDGDEDASPSSRSSRDTDEDEDDADASPSNRSSDDEDEDDAGTGGSQFDVPGPDTDVDAGTYVAPTYDYELSWDPDLWSFFLQIDQPDYAEQSGVDRDALGLQTTDGNIILYIEGSDESWDDTETCVVELFDEIQADIDNGELLDDADGEPFEIVGDDRSASLYLADVTFGDGTTQEAAVLVECVLDEDSGVIVGFTALSGLLDDFVDDGYPLVEDVIGSVSFGGGRTGDDEEDASPRSRSENGDEEEDASPSSRSDNGDDEEDASPSARDDDDETTGVDGDTFTSVDYDFTVTFDEDIWEVIDESSDRNGDQVVLESSLQTAIVTGFALDDGPAGCVDYYLDLLGDRFADGSEVLTDSETGEEFIEEFDDGSLSVYYLSFDGNTAYGSFVICAELSGGDVLGIEFTATAEDLITDEATDERSDLLDGILF
jgi:hypothetical protein